MKFVTYAFLIILGLGALTSCAKNLRQTDSNRPVFDSGVVKMDQKQGWQNDGRHGQMATGNGERFTTTAVKFNKPFNYVPNVIIGVNALDAAGSSIRVNVLVQDVTTQGFTAKFFTWADTKIYMVTANWFAA